MFNDLAGERLQKRHFMYLLNIKISPLTKKELLPLLLQFLEDGKQHHIVTTNPEFIVEAQANIPFKNVLNSADISLIDGVGVLAAIDYAQRAHRSKKYLISILEFIQHFIRISFKRKSVIYQGKTLERITGVDLVLMLVQQEWMKGRKIYLLGGTNNVSALALKRLQQINPAIQLRASNGERNIQMSVPQERAVIIADINNFNPDVLLVAYGHPWQDLWIENNRDALRFRIGIGVGGTFDYLAGRVPRAPKFIRRMGFEWAYRLITQPKRFNRIWTATWTFMRTIVTNDTILS
jgi:N-acetylglucosaminyldiphosphoundecaprenol N-acetyl-beta-D-mannosaminyltransferase